MLKNRNFSVLRKVNLVYQVGEINEHAKPNIFSKPSQL